MYKDKDKQREANRLAQAKFKTKGITKGITSEGITERVLPPDPEFVEDILSPKRGKDIECSMSTSDLGVVKSVSRSDGKGGWILEPITGKPGDTDYNGVCTEAWRAERGR